MYTVAPVSTVTDVGLPSAKLLTITFPLVLWSEEMCAVIEIYFSKLCDHTLLSVFYTFNNLPVDDHVFHGCNTSVFCLFLSVKN